MIQSANVLATFTDGTSYSESSESESNIQDFVEEITQRMLIRAEGEHCHIAALVFLFSPRH